MKGRTRQFVTIALVATALCADRALAAAPALRPQVTSAAGKLVTRLSDSLRRVVPATKVYEFRRAQSIDDAAQVVRQADTTPHLSARLSPLMLRLPPPLV